MIKAEKLFENYLNELRLQCSRTRRIEEKVKGLSWSDWNFYFFTELGAKYYQVWCNRMGGFKRKFGDKLVPYEFLWDLGWFQRDQVFGRTGIEFCALALEQEKSDSKTERWIDFDKLLFADVTHLRVFIGRASNREFETLPKEYAMIYKSSRCQKGRRQFLLILFNESSRGLRVGGWVLNNSGTTNVIHDKTFAYPGSV